MASIEGKSFEDIDAMVQKVAAAQVKYATYTQEQVDAIFKAAAMAASAARIPLAEFAVKETGMGLFEDKVIKNHYASEEVYNKHKNTKTCGIIEEDESQGIIKIAEPIGVIAAVIPTTNPTSTAIFKILLALKTRNGIVISPHPRAKGCTIAAAKLILEAAVKAGAPENIIGWVEEPTLDGSKYLMCHKDIDLILATGGSDMVRTAYSSGKPALGVGSGNVPVIIDETADIKEAVSQILLSKSFDNGVICASEQAVIAVREKYDEIKNEFIARGAYFLSEDEKEKVRKIIFIDRRINPKIVGQSTVKLAEMAGFTVDPKVRVLIGEVENIGHDEPFSGEKLSPILAFYEAADFKDALDMAEKIVNFGGRGHTAALHTNPSNHDRIKQFGARVEVARLVINSPSAHGAIGDLYNFKLPPSLTLGCGSWGHNAVSENIEPRHLLNTKTIVEERENPLWFRVPQRIYFKFGCTEFALNHLKGKKRAFIVTDKFLYDTGNVHKIAEILDKIGIASEAFYEVEPDPKISTVNRGVARINIFQPDVIIAFGGGSPIDAAKIMWLLYENPNEDFSNLAMRFLDIEKRIYTFPELGKKAIMVAIPTTSGTGSEVTPFAVITDDKTHIKYPIADYALTPTMAIIDYEYALSMPPKLTAYSGFDVLTHAIEAYVSMVATDFTDGLALTAIKLIFKYLPSSYKNGDKDRLAKEKVHNASAIAGMAFSNAFLGICHSMAHKLGAAFNIPHGLANAFMLTQVIRYNTVDSPRKQGAFPQYQYPKSKERYAEIADYLGLEGSTLDEKVNSLVEAIENLKQEIGIPASIEAYGVKLQDFTDKLDKIVMLAFDDQCTGANPRYPLLEELKELYLKAFKGDVM